MQIMWRYANHHADSLLMTPIVSRRDAESSKAINFLFILFVTERWGKSVVYLQGQTSLNR